MCNEDFVKSRLCPGGGGTSLLEASRDVSLDGVAFSQLLDYNGVAFSIELLEWCRTSLDF